MTTTNSDDNANENEFFARGAQEARKSMPRSVPFKLREPGREADAAKYIAGWDSAWGEMYRLEQKRRDDRITAHPTAALFPMMSDGELTALAGDIKANGLKEPIVLEQYWFDAWSARRPRRRIVDGRNRYAACLMAGVEPVFVTVDDRSYLEILDHNLHRVDRQFLRGAVRDLTEKLLGATPFPDSQTARDPKSEQAEIERQMDYLRKNAPDLHELVETHEFKLREAACVLRHRRIGAVIDLLKMEFSASAMREPYAGGVGDESKRKE
jgi:hypothetical protein